MKNDVVRWSTGNSKENSKLKTFDTSPVNGRESHVILSTSSYESNNHNLTSTSLVTIVTTPALVQAIVPALEPAQALLPSLTRTLRDTKITKANVTINCDNNFLVKPIETCNLLSRHSKVNDRMGTNKYQQQIFDQRNRNNRDKRFLNLSFRHVVACSLHLSILILLCHFNLGVTASGYIETNTDNLLANEIPYELVYEKNALSGTSPEGHYTHTWAVHIPNGDSGVADQVAKDHGFINLGKIFEDHYHFAHHKVSKRSLQPAEEHQSRLDEDHRVHWAKQQKAKSRQKRDFIFMRPSKTSSRSLSLADSMKFDDPKWPQMWYLNRGNGLDMNVIPAWKEGITGKGIVVTILDDGLESDHPDLEHNYDKKASYDVNSHDDDPMPHYDLTDSNRHGTRCAGEVAATANNSICAVGIAFGARVGGVRMLDGDVTDAVEARSLSLHPQHIDIYSASWGPDDDGKTVDGPGELASRAFLEGVTKGRDGKGSIFIWASGNGGRELDNCNCDGYTNSIWTLSISSATEEGHVPWYSEKCSSTLATTYSSGGQNEKQVVTTDLHHSCTQSHTGTSASAPLAAGIAALVLESNTNLTWRDLQHIVVRTAKPANLKDSTWSVNGVGRRISHSFGYGLMDAAAMVKLARKWKTVPEQQRCEINAPHVDKIIQPRGYITLQLTVKHCLAVNYLEHVQAKITLTSQRRGDIQLYLKSPAGTKVTLLTQRVHDASRSGFNQWPFMSVHTWGESPHGNWQLEIHNEGRYMAKITQWDLIFYGTEAPAQPDDPVHFGPGHLSPLGNDMVNNDIEDFDNSRQWHNMKQVGDNNLSHDKTNVSCLTTTTDNRCLACAPPTFLYKNRCYDECPFHTFEIIPQMANSGNDILSENHLESEVNSNENVEELQSMDRKKRQNNFINLLVTTADPLETAFNICGDCDVSCFKCYGPKNSQCSTCYPGSQLRKLVRSNETFCYVFSERSTGNEDKTLDTNHKNSGSTRVKVALIAAPIIIICAILAFFRLTGSKWEIPFATNSKQVNEFNVGCLTRYNYDRVALISDDEDSDEDDVKYDLLSQTPINLPGKPNTISNTVSENKTNKASQSKDETQMENDTDTKIDCEESLNNATLNADETSKLLDES